MPGILEMTAIYQMYTRKRWMYDENLVYDWYTQGIYQVHTPGTYQIGIFVRLQIEDVTSQGYLMPGENS